MDKDYDIAKMIVDEIIPYSLEYYLGVKINDEYDDIEDLEVEEEDEEENDDEEEEDKGNKRKKKGDD
jgi:nucleosome assembly protein 1-like 1